MQINSSIFETIGVFAIVFIASFLVWILILGIFYLYFLVKKIKKIILYNSLISGLNAWALASLIKLLVPSIRPYMIGGEKLLTTTYHLDSSFPSGHSALAFAIAMSIFLKNKPVGFVYLGGAVLVAVGRVLSKAHFGIDVVAGAILGVMVALIVDSISSKGKIKI